MTGQSISHRVAAEVAAFGKRVGLEVQPARLLSWGGKGMLAVLDQGLFSGANFLVNILLARWLPPEEYGAFAVALSIFYLLAGFHTAVLTEPMMVFGAGKYREHFRRYLGILLWGHWAISALIALVLGVAAFVMSRLGSTAMAQALAGLAIASPFVLLLWLARRAPYVEMRPQWAVVGSGVNFLVVLGGVFIFWRLDLLSSLSGFVLLGAAGGVSASFTLFLYVKPCVESLKHPILGMVLTEHRGYGGWNLLSVVAFWASGQIIMILIPLFLNLAASAVIAAVWTLYRPMSQILQAVGLVVLPYFSRLATYPAPHVTLRRSGFLVGFLLATTMGFYTLVMGIWGRGLLHHFYAGQYDNNYLLLLLLGIHAIETSANNVFIYVMKVMGHLKLISILRALQAIVTTILAVPLIIIYKIDGAMLAVIVSEFGVTVALLVYLWRMGYAPASQ